MLEQENTPISLPFNEAYNKTPILFFFFFLNGQDKTVFVSCLPQLK